MIRSHTRAPRERHPAGTEPTPRAKAPGWFREMIHLTQEYRQATKDYKAAMKALERRMEEIMSNELKLPREWEVIDGIKVVDPGGWSRGSYQSWGTPISREEWDRRVATSTIHGRGRNL